MSKTILCIGDSNTWGYDPRGFCGGRYPASVRWTALLEQRLGWRIHNLGENGRTIPQSGNARELLCREADARRPFDGLCVMLGTNDLLCGASPAQAAARMDALLTALHRYASPLLLVAPPGCALGTWVQDARLLQFFPQLVEKYCALAQTHRAAFANAAAWNIALGYDGVHFSEEGHLRFADCIAEVFCRVFAQT